MTPRSVAVLGGDVAGGMSHSIVAGFAAHGLEATLVPYVSWFPRVHRAHLRGSGGAQRVVNEALRPVMEARLLATLGRLKPDVAFLLKSDTISGLTLRAIRRALGCVLVAYHPDDPFNVGTLLRPGPSHPFMRAQIRHADLYLSWSREVLARAAALGAKRTHYLPFACDPALHPVPTVTDAERAELGASVTFIGNWDEERDRALSGIAERCAAAGVDLAIWGASAWQRSTEPAVRAAWRGRPLIGEEMSKAVAASAININVLRLQNKGESNMRTFEIPCVGGFLLHERSPALDALLPVGEACDDFGDADEAMAKIRHYLAHPDARARVARAGHERALAWTYADWARRVLDWVEDLGPPRR